MHKENKDDVNNLVSNASAKHLASKSFDGATGNHQEPQLRNQHTFKPQISYADDKVDNIAALGDEIDNIYSSGMNKLYDKEQLEYQKLNALQKQIAIEEE